MKKFICAFLLLGALAQAHADEVVFYRCTDPAGALTLQNMPCPKGHRQEKKVMQSVGSTPAGVAAPALRQPIPAPPPSAPPSPVPAAPAAVAPAAASPQANAEAAPAPADATPVITAESRLPPPVLFQCTTYDKDTYITESDEQQSRCVAMRTVGLDGNPQRGAGEACEVVRDQCARVADGALCEAWKKRIGETEVAWRFAREGNEEKNKAEFDRAQKIWNESTCSE